MGLPCRHTLPRPTAATSSAAASENNLRMGARQSSSGSVGNPKRNSPPVLATAWAAAGFAVDFLVWCPRLDNGTGGFGKRHDWGAPPKIFLRVRRDAGLQGWITHHRSPHLHEWTHSPSPCAGRQGPARDRPLDNFYTPRRSSLTERNFAASQRTAGLPDAAKADAAHALLAGSRVRADHPSEGPGPIRAGTR